MLFAILKIINRLSFKKEKSGAFTDLTKKNKTYRILHMQKAHTVSTELLFNCFAFTVMLYFNCSSDPLHIKSRKG